MRQSCDMSTKVSVDFSCYKHDAHLNLLNDDCPLLTVNI